MPYFLIIELNSQWVVITISEAEITRHAAAAELSAARQLEETAAARQLEEAAVQKKATALENSQSEKAAATEALHESIRFAHLFSRLSVCYILYTYIVLNFHILILAFFFKSCISD